MVCVIILKLNFIQKDLNKISKGLLRINVKSKGINVKLRYLFFLF